MNVFLHAIKLCSGIALMIGAVLALANAPYDTTAPIGMIVLIFLLAVFGVGLTLMVRNADPLQDAINNWDSARKLRRNFRNFARNGYPFIGSPANNGAASKS